MVAIEAGRFLRDSQSLFKYFNNDINPFFALTKDFISAIPKCVGNIRIVPPHKDDNSPPATHIRELWTTHSSPHSNSYKCTAIARMDRKTPTPQRKDWGDIAAQQMIKFMTIPQGIPVFYLSDDALAYDRIAQTTKKTSVHRLTSGSFVEALHQASLLPVIGIKDAPYSRIRTTIPPFTNCRLLQNAFPKLVDPFVARLAGIKEAAEAKMPAPTIAPSDPADRKRMENTWGKRGWKSLGSSRSKPQPVPP